MARRSRRPPQQPPSPPATAMEAASCILPLMIELCDRKDGTGADWSLLAEGLFRAGFEATGKLDETARRALLARVHAGAYERMTAGEGGDSMTPQAQHAAPAAARAFDQPTPKGPR